MLSYPLDMMMKSIAFALLSILFMASVSSVYLVGDKVFGENEHQRTNLAFCSRNVYEESPIILVN
jgi:hypothetical protein